MQTESYTTEGQHHTAELAEIPDELRGRRRWMGTRKEPRKGKPGKLDKPPYRVVSGQPIRKAGKTNPENWASYAEALAAYDRGAVDGIGYVFMEDDPYYVVDEDDVIDRDTGEIDKRAAEIIHAQDTYTEISCSGRGVHIIGEGKKPPFAECKSRALGIGVEVYDSSRFVVLTGRRISGATDLKARQRELDELCRRLWPKAYGKPRGHNNGRSSAASSAAVDLDDLELLERARRARTGSQFRALYDAGDRAGYASASEADYALLNMLIFWTAGDRDRIARLFEGSALYRERGKHRDYVWRSVDNALASYVGSFYRPRDVGKARQDEASEADPLDPYLQVLLDPSFWTGRRGASAFKAYAGAVIRGSEHGVIDDDGNLRIGCDTRTLAEYAGVHLRTLNRSALPYLVAETKLLTWRPGKGRRAGSFVLRKPSDVTATNKVSTHFIGGSYVNTQNALKTLRLLIRARRAHTTNNELFSLGMPAMFTAVALVAGGGWRGQNLDEIAERTGRRKSDLRDVLARMKAAGIVREQSEDTYRLADDYAAQYERELDESGVTAAENRQKFRHEQARRRRDEKLPVDEQESDLRGKEHNRRTLDEQRRRAKQAWVEEQRRKVGITASTFLADELVGSTAVSFEAAHRRWRKRGGTTRELRRAVMFGPFAFRREIDGDLYVYPEDAA